MTPEQKARFEMRRNVLADTTLSAGARVLYTWLDDMAAFQGKAHPGTAYLAKTLGFSERSIRRFTEELHGAGYLQSERRTNLSSVTVLAWSQRPGLAIDPIVNGQSCQTQRPTVAVPFLIENQAFEPTYERLDELEQVRDLLVKFPGAAARLPAGPDAEICRQVWEACGHDLDELCRSLREVHLSKQQPWQSWAWFPAVVRARRLA